MDNTFGSQSLAQGSTYRLEQPLHWRVDCLSGCLWLTHDGDPRDVVLEAGDSHVPDRNTRMLLHAVSPARFRLVPRVAEPGPLPRLR